MSNSNSNAFSFGLKAMIIKKISIPSKMAFEKLSVIISFICLQYLKFICDQEFVIDESFMNIANQL